MKNTILIVHYNPRDCSKMVQWAESMDLEGQMAHNREDALQKVEESATLALILIDPLLPGASGFAVAEELAARRPDTPIIIASCLYRKLQMERAGSADNIHMVHLDHPLDEPTFQSLVGPAARRLFKKKAVPVPEEPARSKQSDNADSISLRDILGRDPELSEFFK